MLINLLEIPQEGKHFVCNNKTSELNEILSDLIQNTTYRTEFSIRPLDNGTFELVGFMKTELPEQCSRCGLDFQLQVDEKFKELLIPELHQPRNSKYAKANHFSDLHHEGPSVAEYQGHHFNMGEYIHEVVALAAPFNPCAPADEKGDCKVCGININEKRFDYDEDFEKPESPFSVLKNIKLN
jgi:uncharacterized protein